MGRFLCKHNLAIFLKEMMERRHDPAKYDVRVIHFFHSEEGTIVCEVEAPTREAFEKWIEATGYARTRGEAEWVEEGEPKTRGTR